MLESLIVTCRTTLELLKEWDAWDFFHFPSAPSGRQSPELQLPYLKLFQWRACPSSKLSWLLGVLYVCFKKISSAVEKYTPAAAEGAEIQIFLGLADSCTVSSCITAVQCYFTPRTSTPCTSIDFFFSPMWSLLSLLWFTRAAQMRRMWLFCIGAWSYLQNLDPFFPDQMMWVGWSGAAVLVVAFTGLSLPPTSLQSSPPLSFTDLFSILRGLFLKGTWPGKEMWPRFSIKM